MKNNKRQIQNDNTIIMDEKLVTEIKLKSAALTKVEFLDVELQDE